MERNKVVLVDSDNHPIGQMDKLQAHIEGKLHRAFSVFIFNDKGELLLQQRADHKYHGANLWSNTCCSHPQWEEDIKEAATERLSHEMGMNCALTWVYDFIYNEPVENDLIEHELDAVFVGYSNHDPIINPEEVRNFKWIAMDELMHDLQINPTGYTIWFRRVMPILNEKLKQTNT